MKNKQHPAGELQQRVAKALLRRRLRDRKTTKEETACSQQREP